MYRFCSGGYSLNEVARIYEQERGQPVRLEHRGSVQDLKALADKTQADLGLPRFWDWMGYYYQLNQLSGKTMMRKLDNDIYPQVKVTDLAEFLRQNPVI